MWRVPEPWPSKRRTTPQSSRSAHGARGHRSPPATRSSQLAGTTAEQISIEAASHRSALRPGAHRGSPAGSERWSGPRADRCEAGDVRIRRAQRARHGLLGWHGTGKRRAAGRETASTSRGQFLLNTRSRPRGRPDRAEAGQVTSDDRDLRRPGRRPGAISGRLIRPAGRPHLGAGRARFGRMDRAQRPHATIFPKTEGGPVIAASRGALQAPDPARGSTSERISVGFATTGPERLILERRAAARSAVRARSCCIERRHAHTREALFLEITAWPGAGRGVAERGKPADRAPALRRR